MNKDIYISNNKNNNSISTEEKMLVKDYLLFGVISDIFIDSMSGNLVFVDMNGNEYMVEDPRAYRPKTMHKSDAILKVIQALQKKEKYKKGNTNNPIFDIVSEDTFKELLDELDKEIESLKKTYDISFSEIIDRLEGMAIYNQQQKEDDELPF